MMWFLLGSLLAVLIFLPRLLAALAPFLLLALLLRSLLLPRRR